MNTIDLNADLGEGYSTDEALLGIITTASIACGGHAGDDDTMRTCARIARQKGVVIGAHPGFPDRENFGRVRMEMDHDDIAYEVIDQVERLIVNAGREGAIVRFVKLHGALANMAAEDEELAYAIYEGVRDHHPNFGVLAIDGSAQVPAAESLQMKVVCEAYADRAYDRKGMLVPRTEAGAVLIKRKDVLARCLLLAKRGEILSREGRVFESSARSICIHGDTKGAVALVQGIRDTLEAEGLTVESPFAIQ